MAAVARLFRTAVDGQLNADEDYARLTDLWPEVEVVDGFLDGLAGVCFPQRPSISIAAPLLLWTIKEIFVNNITTPC